MSAASVSLPVDSLPATSRMVPVILSGGSGTRLWPLSREQLPKQCLALCSEHTLLQDTLLRLVGVPELAAPLIVCNEQHRFLVAEQLRQIGREPAGILLEPAGRNTAPAVAIAALDAASRDPETLLLVLPADHLIQEPERFRTALGAARVAAQLGHLVTFGIVPTTPETGYGYIRGADADGETGWQSVAAFVEKPDRERAEAYLRQGGYFWNSGMFLFTARTVLDALAQHAPDILAAAEAAWTGAARDLDFTRLASAPFLDCRSDSLDYAVMEKTDRAVVVPLAAGWSDVGSWAALQAAGPGDAQGNVVLGDVLLQDVQGSYVRAESRLVAAVGVRDHVIVETADAVLVAHKDHAQEVKAIVAQLKAARRDEALAHRRVYRPWGWYEGIGSGERFQVKHIRVHPGATLSLQMHHHRAEHWIVVKGTARVVRGEDSFLLREDESTYIPLGTSHRLENPGKIPLDLIEVQTGSYLGEDDIVRFEDRYGRRDDTPST